MITVDTLVKRGDYPQCLHDMKFWDLGASDISKAQLQGFFYRASIKTCRADAKELSLRIADAINQANEVGMFSNSNLINFSIKDAPLLSGEFRESLELLSLSHRRCAFFSLLMGWEIEQSINLKWSDIKPLSKIVDFNDLCLDVIHSMPRHFRFEYVFWENGSTGHPTQLENVRAEIETIFGYSFDILLKRFQNMVITDPQLYSEEMMDHLSRRYG